MSEARSPVASHDTREWRCFFCDEVFTTKEAAGLHFGMFDSCEPDVTACKLMAHQQHVLEYIRGLEEEISQYQAENHPTIKAMYAVEDEMRRAVVKAEEAGYARGVEDMKRQGYCVEPAKHAAPIEPTPEQKLNFLAGEARKALAIFAAMPLREYFQRNQEGDHLALAIEQASDHIAVALNVLNMAAHGGTASAAVITAGTSPA